MNATVAVAQFLNVSPNQIKRCDEWAAVYFVVVVGRRPTFISKKAVTMTLPYGMYNLDAYDTERILEIQAEEILDEKERQLAQVALRKQLIAEVTDWANERGAEPKKVWANLGEESLYKFKPESRSAIQSFSLRWYALDCPWMGECK